jgi:hypothetical protein
MAQSENSKQIAAGSKAKVSTELRVLSTERQGRRKAPNAINRRFTQIVAD